MPKTPRPFRITLTSEEATELLAPHGDGGHQDLQDNLRAQLSGSNRTLALTDTQLGKIIRYMTQYGSGGFQSRLLKAFKRPLIDLISD